MRRRLVATSALMFAGLVHAEGPVIYDPNPQHRFLLQRAFADSRSTLAALSGAGWPFVGDAAIQGTAIQLGIAEGPADAKPLKDRLRTFQIFDSGSAVVSLIADSAIDEFTTCTPGKRDR